MTFGRGPLVLGTFGRGPWDMVHLDMVLPHPILRSLGRGLRTPLSFGHGPWTPCLWTSSSDISHPSHSPSTHTSRYGVCLVSVII
ncbi:expressed protein [Batrachochytrium dendrobatidis JAM81]|uniref:Expressed protein n=1 Tax=Batrachochytrium dendrobatidis (strain JAM81 / FGSC 10211) TaxID=684364 RepID=F4PEU1_BATDJ|nr:uncharacterized protein BATDEDRAFT_37576 [Batrachochytrium dendrobatidis JAM81]EGF76343.1 expressed protein [Batrachochytrium dendrobatidis JAM81]|eukprot:XP_006683089.1 expressed protein [Batrachochytrium dendrobatidis JAM81]